MKNLSAIEYEASLLGCIISNGNRISNVSKYLKKEDFFVPKHRIIFDTLLNLDLRNIHIEYVTLIDELKKTSSLSKAGGNEYIVELLSNPGLESNITKYAIEISNMAKLREIKSALSKIDETISKTTQKPEDILEKIDQKILSVIRLENTSKDFQSSKKIIDDSVKVIEAKFSGNYNLGIQTQFGLLDDITNGFQNGDLIVLASRPSMGKTAFALNLAANISRSKNVAFFSLEMPSEQLINRILSMRSGIISSKFRKPKFLEKQDWLKIYKFQKEISNYKLFIDDSPGLKLNELVWKLRQLSKSNNKPDIVIIDYMQLINVTSKRSNENRQQEVSIISRTLKQLARELNIPIIALAQLSRRVEQRENKIPIMSDLRESGSIEQDADLIMFLYREDYYKQKKEDSNTNIEKVEVIISKHRNGQIGNVLLFFSPKINLFSSASQNIK